jgi:hypothetical protein
VKGDLLTCLGEPIGALHSVKTYKNYVLRFDVQFHEERGLAGSPAKIQVALHDSGQGPVFGNCYTFDFQHHGPCELHSAMPFKRDHVTLTKVRPIEAWNQVTITSKDGLLEATVNGQPAGKLVDCKPDSGQIHLYSIGHKVTYRNIEIKELPPEEAGWTKLFNGKDFTGWSSDATTWRIVGGAIAGDFGEIKTDRAMPKHFHLRLEVNVKAAREGGEAGGVIHFHDHQGVSPRKYADLLLNVGNVGKPDGWWLSCRDGATPRNVAKLSEWTLLEVIARDRTGEVRINGEKVMDLTHKDYAPIAAPLSFSARGDIHFRNIEIKELPATQK